MKVCRCLSILLTLTCLAMGFEAQGQSMWLQNQPAERGFYVRAYGQGSGTPWVQFYDQWQASRPEPMRFGGGLSYGLQLLPWLYLEGGPQYRYQWRENRQTNYANGNVVSEVFERWQQHRVQLPVQLILRGSGRWKPLFGLGTNLIEWHASHYYVRWEYQDPTLGALETRLKNRGPLRLVEPILLSLVGLEYQWQPQWSVRFDAQLAGQFARYEDLRWSVWQPSLHLGLQRNW